MRRERFQRPYNLLKPVMVLLILALVEGHALRVSAAEALSWKDCVQKVIESNPELAASQAELRSSEADVRGGLAPFLPNISGEFSKTLGVNATDSYDAVLKVEHNLFNSFVHLAEYDRLKAKRRSAEAALERTRVRIASELKTAFAQAKFASQSIRLASEIEGRRKANLDLVEMRFKSGRENKGAFMLAVAYYEESNFDLLQAKNAAVTAKGELARILSINDVEKLEITGDTPAAELPATIDFAELANESPELRGARADQEAATAAFRGAKGALGPSFDLSGRVGKTGANYFPREDDWSITLKLTVPLFSGGSGVYGLRSAQETFLASSYGFETIQRQKIQAVRQAYVAFVEAVERAKVDRKFLDAERVRAEISRVKYRNGLLDFEEWDTVENLLILREKAALESERDRVVAEANWQQSIGKGALQ